MLGTKENIIDLLIFVEKWKRYSFCSAWLVIVIDKRGHNQEQHHQLVRTLLANEFINVGSMWKLTERFAHSGVK